MSETENFKNTDGSSQAGRLLAALDPDYVSVDEHSLKELLAFAREYAKELQYFALENGQVQASGDWSDFLNEKLDLDEIVAFMQNPESFSPERAQPYTRPHFALFLSFLQLLRHAQEQLNAFTWRHLDFYYKEVIQATKKTGVPDQVNVLLELAPDSEQALLPAGTLLNAGADSLGQDRFYSTDNDIIVNHAQIAKLSSVHVEKRVIGIREARENYDGPRRSEAVLQMLQIALGAPLPGDPLPVYETTREETVDYDYLCSLQQLVSFVQTGLFMNFPDFRTLMKFKARRDESGAEWDEINQLLEKAGQNKRNNPDFQLQPSNPRDFEANLELALDGAPDFGGVTLVENIDELYEQRVRENVQKFIRDTLYFEDENDFYRMMQIKMQIDNEWQEINRLLEKAAQEKQDSDYSLPLTDPMDFVTNFNTALGPLTYPSLGGMATIENVDAFYRCIPELERYFFTAAEDFVYLMQTAETWETANQGEEPAPKEWDQVYAILAEAHKTKVYADRKAKLRQICEEQGFEAMLDLAVSGKQQQSSLDSLQIITEYIKKEEDAEFLADISQKPENVEDSELDNACRILELAQRAFLDEPIAQKEEWLNLYPMEDATAVSVNLDLEDDTDTPRWKTFGQGQAEVSRETLPPTTFGWAIASPLLALSEGTRTITLTLGFQSDEFDSTKISDLFPESDASGPFRIEISTETGWIEADTLTATIGDYQNLSGVAGDEEKTLPAIQFKLDFAENVDALAPLSIDEMQLHSPWPALRLMLRQIWQPIQEKTGRYINHYQPFKELKLLKTHIDVTVSGLIPLQLQNDETQLTPNKPFEPFGNQPVAGARFYLGHPELMNKKLKHLDFKLEWMGVPDDIKTHYKNYPDFDKISSEGFSVKISLIDKRLDTVFDEKAKLFAEPDAGISHTISLLNQSETVERSIDADTDTDLLRWSRYWQWELNAPDLQHNSYSAAASAKSLELTAAISSSTEVTAADYQVNPPYTPKVKSLHLDYSAAVEIIMEDYHPGSQIDQIFHIQAFGSHEIKPEAHAQPFLFLPQYDYEGELYIGIREASPPQNLALLFQMAEGSANPDVDTVPVQWHYLSGNRWISLENGNILQDTTRGLINSGIISISLESVEPSTLFSSDLYWIRAAIPQHSSSVCDTVAIHTQAVSATFIEQNNAPDHSPLPAESISDLAEPLPQFNGVRQPYTSYGGKMAEQDKAFYRRLSERLRHKHRAITIWDYEHIILERFPQIYKAKCLPAAPDKPGQVEMIVIPDIRNKRPFNPFEPKVPSDLIADIETYIAETAPGFAEVKVKNAHFAEVKVRVAVRFRPGYDEGYYKQQLNNAISRFLSPWAYEEGADIVIGGRIYANVIINFIEEQPYVDYVVKIKLFSSRDGGANFKLARSFGSEGYWIETEKPDVVLAATRQHEIDIIADTGYEEENFDGINYMKVELDFVTG